MALILAFCTWPLNFFLEGEFNMSVWSFGFDALAAAAVMVYDFTRYDAMQVRPGAISDAGSFPAQQAFKQTTSFTASCEAVVGVVDIKDG